MTKPPSPNIRLTITVTPEVHEAFQRMAAASSLSIGRCMGEWLGDTLDGVEFVTAKLVEARQAPRQVAKDLRQMALGAVDLADDLLSDIRQGKLKFEKPVAAPEREALVAPGQAAAPAPRPVIRGGKSGGKTRTTKASSTRGNKP